MFNIFKKKKQMEAFDSPFLRAKDEWFERYGSYIAMASFWRVLALLCILSLMGSLFLNYSQMNQNKIIPYIVEVDKLGNASAIKPLLTTGEVPQRLIQAEIVNVITNWRTVTADLELQKRIVSKLTTFLGGSARGVIREWYDANPPFERATKILVSIDVTSLPLPVSADSWRVSWIETIRNHMGNTIETVTYEATVSIIVVPPKNEQEIINNPGGIILTNINYGKILN